jgi:hypothetical protein
MSLHYYVKNVWQDDMLRPRTRSSRRLDAEDTPGAPRPRGTGKGRRTLRMLPTIIT